jgi:16S rRNA (adenine1518-N6/adenine1519-N6)-dimethyltransferase
LKRKLGRPKKHLGQNFLYDPAIAERIAASTGLGPGDVAVELGPGRGILTRALASRGLRLVAIELDAALVAALREAFAEEIAAGGVEIVAADFTGVRLRGLLAERGLERCALVGNIPYHHTRDVLFDFLVGEHAAIDRAAIMVQREVGERIVSAPGSRVYGITSVVLQALYKTRLALRVAPGSFFPRPRVSSVVVSFERAEPPLVAEGELDDFVALVKGLFQQRRKTIQNTLKAAFGLEGKALAEVHAATGIDLGRRPEQLSKESFVELARTIARIEGKV